MTQQLVSGLALAAVLAACGGDDTSAASASDAPAAPVDASSEAERSTFCAPAGTSTITGTGPAGSLATSHGYALMMDGFCSPSLTWILTTDDPLAYPYLDDSAVISAPIGAIFDGGAEWSGTFAATIARPDGSAAAAGTVQVDQATPDGAATSRMRATARFNDGGWQVTATIDAPYCMVTVCL